MWIYDVIYIYVDIIYPKDYADQLKAEVGNSKDSEH